MYKWTSKLPRDHKNASERNDLGKPAVKEFETGSATALDEDACSINTSGHDAFPAEPLQLQSAGPSYAESADRSTQAPGSDKVVGGADDKITRSSRFRSLQSKFENYQCSSGKEGPLRTPSSVEGTNKNAITTFKHSNFMASFRKTVFCPTAPSTKLGNSSGRVVKQTTPAKSKQCEPSQLGLCAMVAEQDHMPDTPNSLELKIHHPPQSDDSGRVSKPSDLVNHNFLLEIDSKVREYEKQTVVSCSNGETSDVPEAALITVSTEISDLPSGKSKSSRRKHFSGDIFSNSVIKENVEQFYPLLDRSSSLPRIFSKFRLFRQRKNSENSSDFKPLPTLSSEPDTPLSSVPAQVLSTPMKTANKIVKDTQSASPKYNSYDAKVVRIDEKGFDTTDFVSLEGSISKTSQNCNSVSGNEICTGLNFANDFKSKNDREIKKVIFDSFSVDPEVCIYGSLPRKFLQKSSVSKAADEKNLKRYSNDLSSKNVEESPKYNNHPVYRSDPVIINNIPDALSLSQHQPDLPNHSKHIPKQTQGKANKNEENRIVEHYVINSPPKVCFNHSQMGKQKHPCGESKNKDINNEFAEPFATLTDATGMNTSAISSHSHPLSVQKTVDTSELSVASSGIKKPFESPTQEIHSTFEQTWASESQPGEAVFPTGAAPRQHATAPAESAALGDETSPDGHQGAASLVQRLMRQNNVMELDCVLREAGQILSSLSSDVSSLYCRIGSLCAMPGVKSFARCRVSREDPGVDPDGPCPVRDSCPAGVAQELHRMLADLQCRCLEYRERIRQLSDPMAAACRDWNEGTVQVLLRAVQRADALRASFGRFRALAEKPVRTVASDGRAISGWVSSCPQALLLKLLLEETETLMVRLQFGLAMCRMYAKLMQLSKVSKYTVRTLQCELNCLKGIPTDLQLSEL